MDVGVFAAQPDCRTVYNNLGQTLLRLSEPEVHSVGFDGCGARVLPHLCRISALSTFEGHLVAGPGRQLEIR